MTGASEKTGRLVVIVGPSGAGKDTLMQAACKRRPGIVCAQRVITRHVDAGGEDFISVSDSEFSERQNAGGFLFDWSAHGLRYGIPVGVLDKVEQGKTVLLNGSRGALTDMLAKVPDLSVILVTASADALAGRLARRGRETPQDIARRLARAGGQLPDGVTARCVDNSGSLEAGTARFLAALSSSGDIQPIAGVSNTGSQPR